MDRTIFRIFKEIMKKLMLTLVLALSLASCGHKVSYDDGGNYFAGGVIDSLTNLPIATAWISGDSLGDSNKVYARTDSIGYYVAFAGLSGAPAWVYCGKDGYLTKKAKVIATPDTTTLNFELVPKGN